MYTIYTLPGLNPHIHLSNIFFYSSSLRCVCVCIIYKSSPNSWRPKWYPLTQTRTQNKNVWFSRRLSRFVSVIKEFVNIFWGKKAEKKRERKGWMFVVCMLRWCFVRYFCLLVNFWLNRSFVLFLEDWVLEIFFSLHVGRTDAVNLFSLGCNLNKSLLHNKEGKVEFSCEVCSSEAKQRSTNTRKRDFIFIPSFVMDFSCFGVEIFDSKVRAILDCFSSFRSLAWELTCVAASNDWFEALSLVTTHEID